MSLSAILLVYNEEQNVRFCLQSLSGLCDEILVVDSGSTDGTLDICREYTDKIFVHPFVDSSTQWEWALANLPVRGDWIFPIDADHMVSDGLRRDLQRVLADPPADIHGYFSRHQYIFWNAPIRGFKQCGLRVFRTGFVSLDRSEHVDFRFCIQGRTAILDGVLYEYNRHELSIDSWIDKHRRFSSRAAAEEVLRRKELLHWRMRGRLLGSPDERIVWMKNLWFRMPLFVRPFLYFGYRYFVRGGILDGRTGLIYHFLHAFWYRMVIDIKIAGLLKELRTGLSPKESESALRRA